MARITRLPNRFPASLTMPSIDELAVSLPPLYYSEHHESIARMKFFNPSGSWTWYATEGSPVDANGYYDTNEPKVAYLFFGLVDGNEPELGYFSLTELLEYRGTFGLPIERDLFWEPIPLAELYRQLGMAYHAPHRELLLSDSEQELRWEEALKASIDAARKRTGNE